MVVIQVIFTYPIVNANSVKSTIWFCN